LYLWNIEHSKGEFKDMRCFVVNCFSYRDALARIVSLKYWTQWRVVLGYAQSGCELLSNCIFEILNTVIWKN